MRDDRRAERGALPGSRWVREHDAKDVLERTSRLGRSNAVLGSAIGLVATLVFVMMCLGGELDEQVPVMAVLAAGSTLGWAHAWAGFRMRRAERVREAARVRRAIVVATALSGLIALGPLVLLAGVLVVIASAGAIDPWDILIGLFAATLAAGPLFLLLGNARILRAFPRAIAVLEEIRTLGRREREERASAGGEGAPGGA